MDETPPKSRYWVPMLGHAMRVLETFYDADLELRLQEVTTRTGITKSSTFRILFTLESLGYLEKNDSTGKYRLGRRIFEAAGKARATRSVGQLAQPFLRTLNEQFGETVNLGALQNRQVVYVDTIEGSHSFRLSANIGAVAPFHASALGKAILAFLPETEVAAILDTIKFPRLTPQTIGARDELVKALQKVRRRGYAVDDEEIEAQAFCVAAPIRDSSGRASHAVSLAGPTHRMRSQQKSIIEEVTKAAAAISAQMQATHG